MHMGLQALFKLDDAKAIAACLLAPSPDCLFEVFAIIKDLDHARAKGEDWIEESTLKLVMNRAKNYGAIWKDPADPEFHKLPSVTPEARTVPPCGGQPIADAVAGLTAPLAQEGALTEALLHALERYQGAQAAGDQEWALVQARAVRDLSTALDQHLGSTTAVADLRAALAADIDDVEANAAEGAAVINRIRKQGFSPAERRQLANRGLTAAADRRDRGRLRPASGPAYAPKGSQILADIDAALDAQHGMRDALAGSTDGWNTLVEALEERVDEQHPEADAGGPYGTKNGGPVTLDASASSAAPGAGPARPGAALGPRRRRRSTTTQTARSSTSRSRRRARSRSRSPTTPARSAVDFARVIVEGGDRAPVISSTSPANAVELRTRDDPGVLGRGRPTRTAACRRTAGRSAARSSPARTGATFAYAPTAADVGARMLSVQVTRGGRSAAHSWVVTVIGPDADGDGWTSTPDCDDTRADVHPGAARAARQRRRRRLRRQQPGRAARRSHRLGLWPGARRPASAWRRVRTRTSATARPSGALAGLVGAGRRDRPARAGFAVMADGTVRSVGPELRRRPRRRHPGRSAGTPVDGEERRR